MEGLKKEMIYRPNNVVQIGETLPNEQAKALTLLPIKSKSSVLETLPHAWYQQGCHHPLVED